MIKNASAILAAVLVLNQRKHAAELTLDEEMALLDQKEQARKAPRQQAVAGPSAADLEDQRLLAQAQKEHAERSVANQQRIAQISASEAASRSTQQSPEYAIWKERIASLDALRRRQPLTPEQFQQYETYKKSVESEDARRSYDFARSVQQPAAVASTRPKPDPEAVARQQVQAGRVLYNTTRGMQLPRRLARAGGHVARMITPWFQRNQTQTGVSSNVPVKAPAPMAAPTQGITSIRKPGQTGAGQN